MQSRYRENVRYPAVAEPVEHIFVNSLRVAREHCENDGGGVPVEVVIQRVSHRRTDCGEKRKFVFGGKPAVDRARISDVLVRVVIRRQAKFVEYGYEIHLIARVAELAVILPEVSYDFAVYFGFVGGDVFKYYVFAVVGFALFVHHGVYAVNFPARYLFGGETLHTQTAVDCAR